MVRRHLAAKTVRMIHRIYEGDSSYPAVTHTFAGKTREEARGYFEAHLKTDEFLAAMEKDGQWENVEGRTEIEWDDD